VNTNDFGKKLHAAAAKSIAAQLRAKLGAIRHPQTGEFPTVVITGDRIDNLSIRVEGSPELLAIVRSRLSSEEIDSMAFVPNTNAAEPHAFLSYGWEDRNLAKEIAAGLQANGINTWWAEVGDRRGR
jgi:hypothetical protein